MLLQPSAMVHFSNKFKNFSCRKKFSSANHVKSNRYTSGYDAVLAMLALCVLMDSCFATDANSTVSNGTLLDATDDNEVSYAGVSFNYDKHVEEMMSRFLPATHKPFITQNIIWAFAELYTILNVVCNQH